MKAINLILALPLLLLGFTVSSGLAAQIGDNLWWMLLSGILCSLLIPALLASWIRAMLGRHQGSEESGSGRPDTRPRSPTTSGSIWLLNLLLVAGCVAFAPSPTRLALQQHGAWWAKRAAVLLGQDAAHPVAATTDKVVRDLAALIPLSAAEKTTAAITGAKAQDGGAAKAGDGGVSGSNTPADSSQDGAAATLPQEGVRVHFEKKGRGIVVPVTLYGPRGAVPVKMLFDTGATLTTLDHVTLLKLGVQVDSDAPEVLSHTANGRVRRRLTVIDGVYLQGARVGGGMAVTLCDPCATGKVVGLLGLNFTQHFRATVDHAGGEIVLSPKESPVGKLQDIQHFVKLKQAAGVWRGAHLTVDLTLRNLASRSLHQVKVMAEVKGKDRAGTISTTVAEVPARGRVPVTIAGKPGVVGSRFSLKVVQADW